MAPGGVAVVMGRNDDIRVNTPQLNNNQLQAGPGAPYLHGTEE